MNLSFQKSNFLFPLFDRMYYKKYDKCLYIVACQEFSPFSQLQPPLHKTPLTTSVRGENAQKTSAAVLKAKCLFVQ